MFDALAEARSIQLDAAELGFDWPDVGGALAKLREEVDELAQSVASSPIDLQRAELGDVLFSAVNVSRFIGVDAGEALKGSNDKFRARFGRVRECVAADGRAMREYTLEELDAIWERVKADERESSA